MPLTIRKNLVARAALFVASCVCLLSIAQVTSAVYSLRRDGGSVFAATRHHVERHALQEVCPRSMQPRPPHVMGMMPAIPVDENRIVPRISVRMPMWPIENWPIHRRLAPDSADPEPA
jgi:hypothetical protein